MKRFLTAYPGRTNLSSNKVTGNLGHNNQMWGWVSSCALRINSACQITFLSTWFFLVSVFVVFTPTAFPFYPNWDFQWARGPSPGPFPWAGPFDPLPSGPTSLARKTPRESWLQSVRAHDRAGPTGARGRRLARPAGARPPPGWSVPVGPNPKAGRGAAVRPGPAADPSRCTTRRSRSAAPQLRGGCDAVSESIPASQPGTQSVA